MKTTSFSQKKFNQFILDHGIIGFFPEEITLVSGRKSSWYVNWRTIASDVYLIDQLSDFVLGYIASQNISLDCFYGTPDGATKLAVLCQYKYAKSQKDYGEKPYVLAMGRKTPKEHGKPEDRFFVGAPKGRVVIMEDVTTTGGSLLKSVQMLLETGVEVVASLALTDRNQIMDDGRHVREELSALGVQHYSMSNALELLPLLIKKENIDSTMKAAVITEFQQYGEKEIIL